MEQLESGDLIQMGMNSFVVMCNLRFIYPEIFFFFFYTPSIELGCPFEHVQSLQSLAFS